MNVKLPPGAEVKLTARQSAFIDEYLVDFNGAQAAIRAGYAESGASVEACRLLGNANIAAIVAERRKQRSEKTEIDAAWVLKRLADEVAADASDLYNEDGDLKSIHEWPLIWRQGLVAGLDVDEIREDGRIVGKTRKVKLSDRLKRIELIGKHIGVQAFRDQVQQTGTLAINILPDDAGL